jgi:hypothetical protein
MINQVGLYCKEVLQIKDSNVIYTKDYNFRPRKIKLGLDWINFKIILK